MIGRIVLTLAIVAPWPSVAAAAGPDAATLDAWQRYVQQREADFDRAAVHDGGDVSDQIVARGRAIAVPSGTISDWRGSVFIHGTTVDRLLARLMWPGTPPPQEDVLASRVLSRNGSTLHVYMRLVRHAIVTATYDTEHEMTFTRRDATFATARSVATSIEEVGGDRGFLWRLNSYWRYEQRGDGVLVEVESVSLSRDVPVMVRRIAMPLVDRIARESLARTLDALRRYAAGVSTMRS